MNNSFRSNFDTNLTRRLRVYSVDPSLAKRIETRAINEIVVDVPWESVRGDETLSTALSEEDVKEKKSSLTPGPVGEYVEVVDCDPASGVFYVPVDLDDPRILTSDGLAPSESDPQFHQQMVYAVAMATIQRFIKALGRPIFWSDHIVETPKFVGQFVRRLRIYPHALRGRNAYYSPSKKALLFGYFPVTLEDVDVTPGTTVFTCLSHDIIAHEVTHALLDGIHPRFNEPSNPDVHAFHEAFADLVALFQRFSYPGVLESEIAKTKGRFSTESKTMLARLAGQFGRATGHGSSLRDALAIDPDPSALDSEDEPHKRGAYLVAAVFNAFNLVYTQRVRDLYRLATRGTGELSEGDIHPDLVNRLAGEARDTAAHILRMCIRAIDYCPPVDITFGDYLRAVITADIDINPEDKYGYRVAFIESFRKWGIYPQGTRSMSVESLRWPKYAEAYAMEEAATLNEKIDADTIRKMGAPGSLKAQRSLEVFIEKPPEDTKVDRKVKRSLDMSLQKALETLDIRQDRFTIWKRLKALGYFIWRWLTAEDQREVIRTLGLEADVNRVPPTVYRNAQGDPTIHVQSIRPIVLKTDDFGEQTFLIVEAVQRRRGYLDPEEQERKDKSGSKLDRMEVGDFTYRAGCTFMINPETKEIRWVIKTSSTITDNNELDRMRHYLMGDHLPNRNEFAINDPRSLGLASGDGRNEPFALLHEHGEA